MTRFLLTFLSLLSLTAAQSPTPEPTKSLSLTSVNYGDGFDCDAPLTLNVGPRAFPRLVPTGDTCFLQMTTDDAIARGSSAFLQFRFMEDNVYDFTVRMKYRMFGRQQGIGDGLAFVLHDDPRGASALGGDGGNLGIYGSDLIGPAIIVEFDSFQNSGEAADTAPFAIHVRTSNGTAVSEIAQASAPVRSTSMDDLKEAIISYQGGRLTIRLDGVLRINLLTDFNNVLSRRELFAGFTAATAASADLHDIFEWTMQQGPPTEAPSSAPSLQPSDSPSATPSAAPSVVPSSAPTTVQQRNFFAAIFDIIKLIIAVLTGLQDDNA